MKSLRFRCVAALCVFATAAALVCTSGRSVFSQKGAAKTAGAVAAAADTLPGFDITSLDRSVSACQDFNQFANGGWVAKNPIPAAYSRWGRFEQLSDSNTEQLHKILEGLVAQKNLKAGTNEQKLADYYESCMDEPAIEKAGYTPLDPELQRIAAIKDLAGLEEEVARFHTHRIPAVFGFGAAQDFTDSTAAIAQG